MQRLLVMIFHHTDYGIHIAPKVYSFTYCLIWFGKAHLLCSFFVEDYSMRIGGDKILRENAAGYQFSAESFQVIKVTADNAVLLAFRFRRAYQFDATGIPLHRFAGYRS